MKKIISVLGPPGAGKDTQCLLSSRKFNLKMLSTGEMLRREIRKNTPIGEKIKNKMKTGNLISDAIVKKVLKKEIKNSKKNIILSGTPRNLNQARTYKIDLLIFLKCSKKEIVKRLLKRAKVQHRSDDTKKIISHRWKVYKGMTEPVINYYKKKKKLRIINGNPPVKQVFSKVSPIIKEVLKNKNL